MVVVFQINIEKNLLSLGDKNKKDMACLVAKYLICLRLVVTYRLIS